MRTFALLCLFCTIAASAAAQECSEDIVCLSTEQVGDTVHVYLENRGTGDVTVDFNLELENMAPSTQLPIVATYPARRAWRLVSLVVRDPDQRWGYRSSLQWIFGSLEARHDDGYAYHLPFARGTTHLVGQGYRGRISHQDRYALDFNMPEGTMIYAARGGVVVDYKDTYNRGGPDPSLTGEANYISIQHSDGTIGQYAHLQRGGVRVALGQRIQPGDVIGLSGNTGYSTGPHLHFEVFSVTRDLKRRSLPVRFAVSGQGNIVLEEGAEYRN
jgi:murein DD-endopeptidase MepM/ murein hydrolase activator NlpD